MIFKHKTKLLRRVLALLIDTLEPHMHQQSHYELANLTYHKNYYNSAGF